MVATGGDDVFWTVEGTSSGSPVHIYFTDNHIVSYTNGTIIIQVLLKDRPNYKEHLFYFYDPKTFTPS